MKEFWNQRYSAKEYAYGIEPNEYFKSKLNELELNGRILLPGEGEGRNAVYAANKGLEVFAIDISEEGQKKALTLAQIHNVHIHYEVGDFVEQEYENSFFDAAAMIFAHFPPNIAAVGHQKVGELIRPGGHIILEGFSKNNLKLREKNPKVGGPANIDMLYSVQSIEQDFSAFEILELEEKEIDLKEGEYHEGLASVIRFVGVKGG